MILTHVEYIWSKDAMKVFDKRERQNVEKWDFISLTK